MSNGSITNRRRPLKNAGGGISISKRRSRSAAVSGSSAARMSVTIPSTVMPGAKWTSTMMVQTSGPFGGSTEQQVVSRPPETPAHLARGKGGEAGPGVLVDLRGPGGPHLRLHLLNRVDGALEPTDVSRDSVCVDGHVDDAGVHGHEIVGAEGLGHHGGVGAQPALHQTVRTLAALRLAGHARDDQIARQPHPGTADSLRSHDDAGD